MRVFDSVGGIYSGPIYNSTVVVKYKDSMYISRPERRKDLFNYLEHDIIIINSQTSKEKLDEHTNRQGN